MEDEDIAARVVDRDGLEVAISSLVTRHSNEFSRSDGVEILFGHGFDNCASH